jgi:hypothetical protein
VLAFLERLDPEDKEYFLDKAYFCEGHIILDNSIGDLGNHSDDPNIVEDIAVRDILSGEELLEDYRSLDKDTPAWYLALCHEVLDEDKSKFYASLGI